MNLPRKQNYPVSSNVVLLQTVTTGCELISNAQHLTLLALGECFLKLKDR